jgi:hypothetical protein
MGEVFIHAAKYSNATAGAAADSDVRATNAAAGVQILTWLARRGVVGMQGS